MEVCNWAPNKKNLTILFLAAFLLRLIVFIGFIQKNRYYKQPDSGDYHHGAMCISLGRGMHKLRDNRPIFWRTPGYPLYLSWFYNFFGIRSLKFEDNSKAQVASIIVQIILNSLLSILILFLALILTKSLTIAWLTAWISALHVGFVLSSTYLLTEALSMMFIIPFFIYFYKSFYLPGQITPKKNGWLKNTILAAIFLGIFTWVRPMGQFVAVASMITILILDKIDWKTKFKKIGVFFLVFLLITGPWFIRNYNITGKFFFCPMFGLYLNTFPAPKIIRDTTGKPLTECINHLYKIAKQEIIKDYRIAKSQGKDIAMEISHLKAALPVIKAHPFLFLKNWMQESAKTSFDLYSSQLVAIAKDAYYYDPPEEFLSEKLAECLYKQKMNPFMRLIIYLELLFAILKWIGLIAGAFIFLLFPLIKRFKVPDYIKQTGLLWLKLIPMIGAFIIMTGGFGYARLRLPVESLMVILALTFWYWLLVERKKSNI